MTTNSSNSPTQKRLQLIEEMLESDPKDPFLIYAAALEYEKSGKITESIRRLEQLHISHPDYLATYYRLGQLYESIAEINKALEIYRSGQEIARAQHDRKTLGELSEAIQLLEDED